MHLKSTDGIVKRDTSFNISVNGQSRGVAHGVAERDISENRSVAVSYTHLTLPTILLV